MDGYVDVAPRTRSQRRWLRVFTVNGAIVIALALLFVPLYAPESLSQITDAVPAQQSAEQRGASVSGPIIRAKVNEVLVPVVVRDAHGHPVDSLSKDDFQVFDNGKPQAITGFTIIKRGSENSAVNSSITVSNTTDSPTVSQPSSVQPRVVAFLFDDFNITDADLPYAQQSAIKALDSSLAPADFAIVLSTSGANSGVTRDHEKLKQAILGLKAKSFLRTNENECHNVDYYMGDRIINQADVQALQAETIEVVYCFKRNISLEAAEAIARTNAERAVHIGERNYQANLGAIRLILNKLMAPLPGQHVIVVISPGFFAPTPEAAAMESEILDIAARSSTIIDTIDARGLYTLDADASVGRKLDQASQRLLDQYHRSSMDAVSGVMEELADGTGGTFYHNNNDLEGGFKTLLAGAECRYLLAFSPVKMKPRVHHRLKVKVSQRGLTVQARSGYSAPPPEKHKS
jgi:VWFA-related protein